MALNDLVTLMNGGLIDTSSTRNALNAGTSGFCQRRIIEVELSSVKLMRVRFLGVVDKPENDYEIIQ